MKEVEMGRSVEITRNHCRFRTNPPMAHNTQLTQVDHSFLCFFWAGKNYVISSATTWQACSETEMTENSQKILSLRNHYRNKHKNGKKLDPNCSYGFSSRVFRKSHSAISGCSCETIQPPAYENIETAFFGK